MSSAPPSRSSSSMSTLPVIPEIEVTQPSKAPIPNDSTSSPSPSKWFALKFKSPSKKKIIPSVEERSSKEKETDLTGPPALLAELARFDQHVSYEELVFTMDLQAAQAADGFFPVSSSHPRRQRSQSIAVKVLSDAAHRYLREYNEGFHRLPPPIESIVPPPHFPSPVSVDSIITKRNRSPLSTIDEHAVLIDHSSIARPTLLDVNAIAQPHLPTHFTVPTIPFGSSEHQPFPGIPPYLTQPFDQGGYPLVQSLPIFDPFVPTEGSHQFPSFVAEPPYQFPVPSLSCPPYNSFPTSPFSDSIPSSSPPLTPSSFTTTFSASSSSSIFTVSPDLSSSSTSSFSTPSTPYTPCFPTFLQQQQDLYSEDLTTKAEQEGEGEEESRMNGGKTKKTRERLYAEWILENGPDTSCFASHGQVKFFDANKGWGYIVDHGTPLLQGQDIWVHYTSIIMDRGHRFIVEGEPVEYKIMWDSSKRQLKALEVQGPGGKPVLAALNRPAAVELARFKPCTGPLPSNLTHQQRKEIYAAKKAEKERLEEEKKKENEKETVSQKMKKRKDERSFSVDMSAASSSSTNDVNNEQALVGLGFGFEDPAIVYAVSRRHSTPPRLSPSHSASVPSALPRSIRV